MARVLRPVPGVALVAALGVIPGLAGTVVFADAIANRDPGGAAVSVQLLVAGRRMLGRPRA
jgi:hypothetical protein